MVQTREVGVAQAANDRQHPFGNQPKRGNRPPAIGGVLQGRAPRRARYGQRHRVGRIRPALPLRPHTLPSEQLRPGERVVGVAPARRPVAGGEGLGAVDGSQPPRGCFVADWRARRAGEPE